MGFGENCRPFITENGDEMCFPYGWCGKRLENGEEDNVWDKMRVFTDRNLVQKFRDLDGHRHGAEEGHDRDSDDAGEHQP